MSVQARELARRTYRAPAIAECKKAICSEFPEAFKSDGKGIIPAQAKNFRGARMLTLVQFLAVRGGLMQVSCFTAAQPRPGMGPYTARSPWRAQMPPKGLRCVRGDPASELGCTEAGACLPASS